MVNKNYKKKGAAEQVINHETELLMNHSSLELKKLAKNLSDGKYQKNSLQRDKILQQLVKQLSSPKAIK